MELRKTFNSVKSIVYKKIRYIQLYHKVYSDNIKVFKRLVKIEVAKLMNEEKL